MTDTEAKARTDLIARIESADGPSYALDCEIWDQIYPGERQARFDKLTAKGQPYHMRLGPADMDGYVKPHRSFTASIDAALTLVPGGCLSMAKTIWADVHTPTERTVGYASVDRYFKDDAGLFWKENFLALGETPALALAAAALKARGV